MANVSNAPLPANEDIGPALLSLSWVTLGLAWAIVGTRVYVRFFSSRRAPGPDDYTIVIALGIATWGGVVNVLQVQNGFGRHIQYLSHEQLVAVTKWSFNAELQNCIGVYVVKISVCLFILRLLLRQRRWARALVYANMAVFTIITIVNCFLLGLQCIPLKASFDPRIQGKCFDKVILNRIGFAYNSMDVITDFVCASLPLFILKGLQMDLRTKVALGIVMGFGYFTAACSIGKTVKTNFVSSKDDVSWDLVEVEIWSLLEENLGLIVASLPSLRQFSTEMSKKVASLKSLRSTHSSTYGSGSQGTLSSKEPSVSLDSKRPPISEPKMIHESSGIKKTTEMEIQFVNHPGPAQQDIEVGLRRDSQW